jgi:hypothetical protein
MERLERYGESHLMSTTKAVMNRLADGFQWDGGPSKLTDEQLENLTEHLLRIAYGDDHEAIAAARREAQIDAGEKLDPNAASSASSSN